MVLSWEAEGRLGGSWMGDNFRQRSREHDGSRQGRSCTCVINTSYVRGARTKRPAKQADTQAFAAELNPVIIFAVFVPQAERRYSVLN